MTKRVTSAKTMRAKARRAQADIDAIFHVVSNGFTGTQTGTICATKMTGAHHKKLSVAFPSKRFKRWGEV